MIQVDLTRYHRDKGHSGFRWKSCPICKELADRVNKPKKKARK